MGSLEPRSEEHGTASGTVHLKFQTMILFQTRGAEGGRQEGRSTETPAHLRLLNLFRSSVVVDRSSLQTREDVAQHVVRHFSDVRCERLVGWVGHVLGELWDFIQPGDRRTVVGPDESLVVVSTTTLTYQALRDEEWGVAGADDMTDALEEQLVEFFLAETEDLAAGDSLFAYEPPPAPASKASVDALERKKVDDQEEEISEQKMCVVCQDEVGRGDCLAKMPCSHEFHEGCILAWLKRAHSCPVCRLELPVDDDS
ncbi:probable E3 ubiquitin-protein ligase RHC2A [Nymphaea colorata]|nr:probable E3 ubiquitin-protein ligase RHC2A [Nymphaea colorata]XP_031489669.1 probable E3 ubiquitin-protein ligase RHC2A [Nymphaea colorata]